MNEKGLKFVYYQGVLGSATQSMDLGLSITKTITGFD